MTSVSVYEERLRKIYQEISIKQPLCDSGNFSACGRMYTLNLAKNQEGRELAVLKKDMILREKERLDEIEKQRLQQIEIQNITFNEQTNSGDYNETPITDINLSSGCSECTGTEISSDPILRKGYHTMPDGSLMKDGDMEKKPLNNNMKIVGIAAAGVIGLLLYTKGVLK